MALAPDAVADDTYVGLFMVEEQPDWWLPDGYSLTPTGAAPVLAWDPTDTPVNVYPVLGYKPPPERLDSIAEVIGREIGPLGPIGIGPKTREALGMNRTDLLGAVNRAVMAPVDAAAALLDLANYGIDAALVAGPEEAYRAGWIGQNTAGQLQSELFRLSQFLGAEIGRSGGAPSVQVRMAQMRVAAMARGAARVAAPVVLRMEQATGVPLGRVFRVVGLLQADASLPGTQARTLDAWLVRVRAGKKLELEQLDRYEFSQLYVVSNTGKGFRVLDFYGPKSPAFTAGPVSFKATQLADIKVASANAALQEAYRNFRPGTLIADVPTRPRELTERTLSGQLWLEVPVQNKPVPVEILTTAKRLSICIRDVTGRIYE